MASAIQTFLYMPAEQAYIHRSTRFAFPDVLGAFPRHHLSIYDSEGRDVSVSYDLAGVVSATIYLYPIPGSLATNPPAALNEHFKALLAAFLRERPEAAVLSTAPVTLVARPTSLAGKRALLQFSERETLHGATLHLFVWNGQFLKIKTSYKMADRDYAFSELGNLFDRLCWPGATR